MSECEHCGAPVVVGLAACNFCQSSYPGVNGGVGCPGCGAVCTETSLECAMCRRSLSWPCLFCGTASPTASANCVRCGEAAEGAAERKAALEAQRQQEQTMALVGQGVGVAATLAANPVVVEGLFSAFGAIVSGLTDD